MAFISRSKCGTSSTTFKRYGIFTKACHGRVRSVVSVSSSLNENTKTQRIKSFESLPGPISLPLLGAGWKFLLPKSGEPLGKRILSVQAELVNKYGRIYLMDVPGVKIVQLSDPLDVATVLRSEAKYPHRLEAPIIDYYRERRRKAPGVFFANGPEWYKHRSVISKRMLRPKEVAEYAVVFNEIITDFIERLLSVRQHVGSERENEVQGLDRELFKWSFESVADVLFDTRFGCFDQKANAEAQTFIEAIGNFLYHVINVMFVPVWFYKIYETQHFKKFVHSFDTMHEYAELFIARRLKELEANQNLQTTNAAGDGEKTGFFEFLLSSGKLSKDDLLATVIDVLFAGVDTTSNTMQWILYLMAKKPEKQNILRREVLSVLGDSQHASPNTLANMPYLKACVRETLRLYPVLSGIPRRPTTDLVLSGYHIPAGSAQLEFLVYQMSRDEKIFSDAGAFRPERWLRKKDEGLKESLEAFASIPFGFGTRMCVGRRVAELELHLLLARIMQQFVIRYPPDADDVEPSIRGVIIPDRPMRVKFVDR